jgi:hypothetical protein
MERGISPGEPGWYFVPIIGSLAAPVTLVIFAAAAVYEIAIRLDPRRWRTTARRMSRGRLTGK